MDKQMERELARIREKVEILTGERGPAQKAMSAIRRGELQPLASIALQSAQVAAAPTQDEFNALQADVQTIATALTGLSNLFGNAKLPSA